MASVQIKHLRKSFRGIEAVKEIVFTVADAEFFCLLGPPGAGKTTILRIIAGLEQADQGEIYLGDELVNDVSSAERDVAMIFEDAALYPHKTAYENLAYPLRLRKLPRSQIDYKVREIASLLHITHILGRRPGTFSGGELRRVAIGRALVRRPCVLLLDQPFTDLDAKVRQEMAAELKRLQLEVGQTMIYATHDFEEAVSMADRVLVINEGSIEQLGSPEEVYDRPKTTFVGSFVGSPAMNLIRCHAEKRGEMIKVTHPAFRLDIASAIIKVPQHVILGIRPEDINIRSRLVREQEAISVRDSATAIATVDVVQLLGAEQIVDLSLEDDTPLKMVASEELSLSPGEKLEVRFPVDWISFFDKASGRRIELEKEGS